MKIQFLFTRTIVPVFLAMILISSSAFAAGAPVKAKITAVKGLVEAQPSGGSWAAVKEGGTVTAGSKLRTGPGASCLMTWGGGNAVKVSPLSNVTVDQLEADGAKETASLSFTQGKVLARAKKLSSGNSSFLVKTPTAVAGVRGTEFAMTMTGDTSSVQVVDGSVEVAPPGGEPVIVEPGFQVNVVEGMTSIPVPEPIPPAELQELQTNMQEVSVEAEAAGTVETSSEESSSEESSSEESTSEESSSEESTTEEGATSDTTAEPVDAGATEVQEVNVDAAVNAVDQTLENTAAQELTDSIGETQYETGTVQVDIYVGQ